MTQSAVPYIEIMFIQLLIGFAWALVGSIVLWGFYKKIKAKKEKK